MVRKHLPSRCTSSEPEWTVRPTRPLAVAGTSTIATMRPSRIVNISRASDSAIAMSSSIGRSSSDDSMRASRRCVDDVAATTSPSTAVSQRVGRIVGEVAIVVDISIAAVVGEVVVRIVDDISVGDAEVGEVVVRGCIVDDDISVEDAAVGVALVDAAPPMATSQRVGRSIVGDVVGEAAGDVVGDVVGDAADVVVDSRDVEDAGAEVVGDAVDDVAATDGTSLVIHGQGAVASGKGVVVYVVVAVRKNILL